MLLSVSLGKSKSDVFYSYTRMVGSQRLNGRSLRWNTKTENNKKHRKNIVTNDKNIYERFLNVNKTQTDAGFRFIL